MDRSWTAGPGDTLIVMVDRSSSITVHVNEKVRSVRLDVLAPLSASYLMYVPKAVHISHSRPLKRFMQEKLGIDPRYLGDQIVAVPDGAIVDEIINTDGMNCSWCKRWYPMAEGNQPDESLKCYRCRNNPYARRQIP